MFENNGSESDDTNLMALAKLTPIELINHLFITRPSIGSLGKILSRVRLNHKPFAIGLMMDANFTNLASDLIELLSIYAEASPQEVLELLSIQDFINNTLGHAIVGVQSTQCTLAYVQLLVKLAKTNLQKVLELLRVENQLGEKLLHKLVRSEDVVRQKCLILLSLVADASMLEFLAFIASKDGQNNTIGIYLVDAENDEPNEQFIALLSKAAKTHPKEVIDYLSIHDKSGITYGLKVADGSSRNTNLQLLALLAELAVKNPHEILNILTAQNDSGKTIGMYVVAATETGEKFLALLNQLRETDPEGVLKVLLQTDKDGKTLGHYLAQAQNGTGRYLELLASFLNTHPTELLNLLMTRKRQKQSSEIDQTLGHLFASDSEKINNAFIALLSSLAEKNPEKVSKLLEITDYKGRTLWHRIIEEQGEEVNLHFIKLIALLAVTNPDQVINILEVEEDNESWTVGHQIVDQLGNSIVLLYIALLRFLAQKKPEKVMDILGCEDDHQYTTAHCFFESANTEINKQYFALLDDLAKYDTDDAITLLLIQNNEKESVGHVLVREGDWAYPGKTESVLQYLDYLEKIANTNPDKVLEILALKDSWGNTIGHGIVNSNIKEISQRYMKLLAKLEQTRSEQVLALLITANNKLISLMGLEATISEFGILFMDCADKSPKKALTFLSNQLSSTKTTPHCFMLCMNENKAISIRLLAFLSKTMDTHPTETLLTLGKLLTKQTLSLFFITSNTSMAQEVLGILSRGSKTNRDEVISHLKIMALPNKSISMCLCNTKNVQLIYSYAQLLDQLDDPKLKNDFLEQCKKQNIRQEIDSYITSCERSSANIAIAQCALQKGTTLHCIIEQNDKKFSNLFKNPYKAKLEQFVKEASASSTSCSSTDQKDCAVTATKKQSKVSDSSLFGKSKAKYSEQYVYPDVSKDECSEKSKVPLLSDY